MMPRRRPHTRARALPRSLGSVAMPLFGAMGAAGATLPLITSAVASFIKLYLLLLFVRVLLTWFPNVDWQGQPWVTLRQVTDPYLNLFRNLIPPLMGQIDFTPSARPAVLARRSACANAARLRRARGVLTRCARCALTRCARCAQSLVFWCFSFSVLFWERTTYTASAVVVL